MSATVRIPAKRSKFNSKITEYNGRKYHSAAEAKQAAELDLLMRAGMILDWVPQYAFPIKCNGVYICTIIVDFKAFGRSPKDNYYIEVKGMETSVYKLKLKLLKACYPDIDLRIVKV